MWTLFPYTTLFRSLDKLLHRSICWSGASCLCFSLISRCDSSFRNAIPILQPAWKYGCDITISISFWAAIASIPLITRVRRIDWIDSSEAPSIMFSAIHIRQSSVRGLDAIGLNWRGLYVIPKLFMKTIHYNIWVGYGSNISNLWRLAVKSLD